MPSGNGGPSERFEIVEGTPLGEIARYKCIRNEKLGSGAFADVYAVENISTHQKFALKLLPEGDITRDEIAALKTANQPDSSGTCPKRFIRHVDSFLVELPVRNPAGGSAEADGPGVESKPWHCLVTEPLCQWTLEDKLEDQYQTYTLHSAVKYLLQLAEATVDLEARRLRHGDLNPRNVYLTYEDDVRVGDFGIAGRQKAHGGDRNSEGIIVNDHAKPPEAADPAKEPDIRWDLWALGVLAYRLLTRHKPSHDFFLPKGRPAVSPDYAVLIRERQLFGETAVPDKLVRLVQVLLSGEPDNREDANYACSTLRRIYNELPINEKLVRAREAYDVSNFYEAKDLCFSVLDEGESVPALPRAEALVLKGLSLLSEESCRCVPKAKKALCECRHILEELMETMNRVDRELREGTSYPSLDSRGSSVNRRPSREEAGGVQEELGEEGQRCLDRAGRELELCNMELARLRPGHDALLTAQRGSECLERSTAALRDFRHYRKVCELWGLWQFGHGWVEEEEIRYPAARRAYAQALAMFKELRDWRRYVPAVLRLAKLQRKLVMLPQARRVLTTGRDQVEQELRQWALCNCDTGSDGAGTPADVGASSAVGSAFPTSLPGSTAPASLPPNRGATTCRHREVLDYRLTAIRIELAALEFQAANYKEAKREYEATKALCCRARMCTQLELASIYKGLGALHWESRTPEHQTHAERRQSLISRP